MSEATQQGGDAPREGSLGDVRLTGLYVYPVKSARGVSLDRAELVDTGLRHDRRWMVVDEQGEFVTQRTVPRLALLRTALTADELVLSAEGLGEVRLSLHEEPGTAGMPVRVWSDRVPAQPERPEASELVCELLGTRVTLVRFPDAGVREVPLEYGRVRSPDAPVGERVRFADAYPLLLISQGSLDLLNEKLAAQGVGPFTMERFRPNLVVDGCEAHAEDTWSTLTVCGVRFTVAKPCARCAVTTVDPDTAATGKEPLRTLSRYRRWPDGRVMFGQNLVHHATGTLEVGAAAVPTPADA